MEDVNPTPARFTSVMLRLAIAPAVLTLATAIPTQAAVFPCAAGDVACVVNAINQSNTNGERNTIRLEAGTYTLSAIDNDTNGPNGLPSITGHVVIRGNGAAATTIARASSAPRMRLLHVGASGRLTVDGVTLTGGGSPVGVFPVLEGAGLLNAGGVVNITRSVVSANRAGRGGGLMNIGGEVNVGWSTFATNIAADTGGVLYARGGVVRIVHSQLTENGTLLGWGVLDASLGASVLVSHTSFHGNGLCAVTLSGEGTKLVLANSSLTENYGEAVAGLIIGAGALAFVTNTTVAHNPRFLPFPSGASAITNGGTLLLLNSTIADYVPMARFPGQKSALETSAAATSVLANTIVGRNITDGGLRGDCVGPTTSLGHNLIGVTRGCSIALQSSDRTGDLGLGAITGDGSPGNGHIPLVAGSQAIDAGNDILCSRRDQIGNRRIRPCDIGAIEFQRKDRGRAKVTADHSALERADLSKLLADLEHVASELQWVTANDAEALKEIGSLVDQVTRLARPRKSADGDKKDK